MLNMGFPSSLTDAGQPRLIASSFLRFNGKLQRQFRKTNVFAETLTIIEIIFFADAALQTIEKLIFTDA